MAGIIMDPFGTAKKRQPTLGNWMNFSTTRKRFDDIKILNHLMAVIVRCHCNALSGEQLSATGAVIGTIAFFLVDINLQALVLIPGCFLAIPIPCVYYSVKTWIICAYAICDACCAFDANQKGRSMAATTDAVNTLFAMGRMGWCFALW
ncbi:hypothetical protein K492DRAFT_46381 [Lichtheimia hyalospora FSU 10163]|nr:hypothetical protein K492DRAFT_46381 [Lichtheimia hyalospora FSU 10163]